MISVRRNCSAGITAGLVLMLALAACGSSDDKGSGDTSTTTEGKPSASGPIRTVTATDYEYAGTTDPIVAGTRLVLHNEAPVELHEMVVVRRPAGETRTAAEIAKLPEAELDAILGGGPPALVMLARPGEDGKVAVGKAALPPGEYIAFCAIPQGVDPDEYFDPKNQTADGPPNVEGGPPHFTLGMAGDLTVE